MVDTSGLDLWHELHARGRPVRVYVEARRAGAAFCSADRTELPRVLRFERNEFDDGQQGWIVAFTMPFSPLPGGRETYHQELPHAHPQDAEFRAGYIDALEHLVRLHLKATDWEQARPADPTHAPRLDHRLYDDLQVLAFAACDRAIDAWLAHTPRGVTAPTFLDPLTQQVVTLSTRADLQAAHALLAYRFGPSSAPAVVATAPVLPQKEHA